MGSGSRRCLLEIAAARVCVTCVRGRCDIGTCRREDSCRPRLRRGRRAGCRACRAAAAASDPGAGRARRARASFIKLGQQLSIRPDVVPPPALEVLRGLCDAVPAVPTHVALETVREDLGDVVIEGLDASAVPVAAASLGQVYRAKFEGQDVAVKIQRPNMACGVARDLYLLGNWARFVESVKKILIPKQRPYDIQLIDAFCRGAYGELDYEHEAANQRRFKEAIANGPASLRDVHVPEVRLATRRVLVSDWVEGERLSQASQPTIKRLVPLGVELFCWQLLDLGFYHCDPHPGNLLVELMLHTILLQITLLSRPLLLEKVTPLQ